jgi:hypothetical protein
MMMTTKTSWEVGFEYEQALVAEMNEMGIAIQRADTHNFSNPDFIIQVRSENKKRTTPFLKSKKYVGIEPSKCIVIDREKLDWFFSQHSNMLIIFDIDYTGYNINEKGKFIISTNRIKKLMQLYPNRIQTFPDRQKGRDIERFFLDTDEMISYEEFLQTINQPEEDFIQGFQFTLQVDAKKRLKPFFSSLRLIGIPAEECVVVDMPKLKSYFNTNKNTLLVFDIDYSPRFNTKGKYMISTNKLQTLIKEHPERIRPFKDHEKGFDKDRFYFSIHEMTAYDEFIKVVA